MAVDGINQSAFLSASQLISQNTIKSQSKEKTQKAKKRTFSSSLEKQQEEYILIQEGFPVEISGMEDEEAAVYLRDEAEMAADRLRENPMPQEFAEYKKKVALFLKFLTKKNFEVKVHTPKTFRPSVKKKNPKVQVLIINQKLDEIASYMLSTHKDVISMLAKVDEIKGLLIDLMAS